jgi:hypothetical protein
MKLLTLSWHFAKVDLVVSQLEDQRVKSGASNERKKELQVGKENRK